MLMVNLNICLRNLFIFILIVDASALQHNSNNKYDNILQSEFKKEKPLKILIYSPSISWSHAQFLGRIADTLVDAGHEVVSNTVLLLIFYC